MCSFVIVDGGREQWRTDAEKLFAFGERFYGTCKREVLDKFTNDSYGECLNRPAKDNDNSNSKCCEWDRVSWPSGKDASVHEEAMSFAAARFSKLCSIAHETNAAGTRPKHRVCDSVESVGQPSNPKEFHFGFASSANTACDEDESYHADFLGRQEPHVTLDCFVHYGGNVHVVLTVCEGKMAAFIQMETAREEQYLRKKRMTRLGSASSEIGIGVYSDATEVEILDVCGSDDSASEISDCRRYSMRRCSRRSARGDNGLIIKSISMTTLVALVDSESTTSRASHSWPSKFQEDTDVMGGDGSFGFGVCSSDSSYKSRESFCGRSYSPMWKVVPQEDEDTSKGTRGFFSWIKLPWREKLKPKLSRCFGVRKLMSCFSADYSDDED